MAKKLILITVIVALAIFISLPDQAITENSEEFIVNLVENQNPEDYCLGDVLYRVATRETPTAEVLSISSLLIDHSKTFARVYIEVEMKLPGDIIDVGFYELELIKSPDWKVYSLRETMPRVQSFSWPQKDISGTIEQLYIDSFYQLSKGDISSLAGAARTAYKKQPPLKASSISDVKTEILYNNKLVIARHSYTCDSRPVSVLVNYYDTNDGYKIVAIQSI